MNRWTNIIAARIINNSSNSFDQLALISPGMIISFGCLIYKITAETGHKNSILWTKIFTDGPICFIGAAITFIDVSLNIIGPPKHAKYRRCCKFAAKL